jgi:hypothetical protein
MTIKSAMDDGGVATETMADRLRNVQTETWQRMEWVHDEAELAWEAYTECLLLRSSSGAAAAAADGGDGDAEKVDGAGEKGKGKEKEREPVTEGGAADLVERVSQLKTDWGEQELLQAVSGVEGGGGEEIKEGKGKGKGKGKETQEVKIEEPAGARKGAKARATKRGGAMDID